MNMNILSYCYENLVILNVHPDFKPITLTRYQMGPTLKHRPAPRHYYNPPGVSLWKHRHKITSGNIPQLMLYGDSHLANVRKWERQPAHRHGPRPLDMEVLKTLKHCSVGGSTFGNIFQRTQNINVPKTQPNRGNQWKAALNDPKCNPAIIYVSLGSNDCDTFGQKLAWLTQQQMLASEHPLLFGTDMIRFNPNTFYESQLELILSQIDRVINRLEKCFPESEIVYSSVFERCYWDPLTLHMACTINWYMRTERQLRLVNLNGKVPRDRIKDDLVHFTNLGYHIFMDKGIGMVLDRYYNCQ